MHKRNKKVTKFRKSIQPNIGVLIFLMVFVYLIINVFIYIGKDHLSIYEVVEGKNSDNNLCKGIAIRDEKVVYTNKAGYINYYLKEGERVAKNAIMYSLDESGTIYEQLKNNETETKLSSDDIVKVRDEITSFKKKFSSSNFSTVIDFKYNIDNTILELSNFNTLKNLDTFQKESLNNSFQIVKADASGVVSYSVDSMEELKTTDVTSSTFLTSNYKRKQLRSTDLLEKNSPVYKLVTSENWSIIIKLSKDQYDKVYDQDKIAITFVKDGLTATPTITSYKKGDDYFAKLDFDSYMIRYITERFLDIELSYHSASGLKIPVSSIVKKKFYKIPLECFTEGGDSGSKGIVKETYRENGDVDFVFIPTDIYFEDNTYGYIDTNVLKQGDSIQMPDSDKEYEVSVTEYLTGVYNVNKGYAVFRRIEKLYENEEYCIIKKDTSFGLSAYDHIALNGNKIKEQEIIY